MNVNGLQQYTQCEPATAENANVPVMPVCRYIYVGEVLHVFVEAPGVTQQNVIVNLTTTEPMELIINALAQREHRVNRRYYARIRMNTNHHYILETSGWDVFDGEIHLWFPFVFNLPQPQPQVPLII